MFSRLKRKQLTLHFLLLRTSCFVNQQFMLCIKISWLLAEAGFQITIRYFTCKLGRMLLATLTVVLK